MVRARAQMPPEPQLGLDALQLMPQFRESKHGKKWFQPLHRAEIRSTIARPADPWDIKTTWVASESLQKES